MSVLFGEWNFDGKPVDSRVVSSTDAMLAPYAPDAHSHYKGDGIVLAYHGFEPALGQPGSARPADAADVAGGSRNDPKRNRCGCFLPDLTRLATASSARLPAHIWVEFPPGASSP